MDAFRRISFSTSDKQYDKYDVTALVTLLWVSLPCHGWSDGAEDAVGAVISDAR